MGWVKVNWNTWYYFDSALFISENPMITDADLEKWFMYHAPKPEQLPKYLNIRAAGKMLAKAILDNTPSNADQTAAIRKVREAIMTANASIACEE